MPKNNKRRFIDPRKSVTFEVVPRNQVDPLAADESAPKNVLVEKKSRRVVEPEYQPEEISVEKRLEEQRKYGVYFDDDYNYLQHLRDVRVVGEMERIVRIDKHGGQVEINRENPNIAEDDEGESSRAEQPRISLPSSVFPSHVEERVGHLNKGVCSTSFRPDWDPDVMAALDEDVEDCDELEDDFVALASGGADCIEDLGAGDEEFTARRFYYTEYGPLSRNFSGIADGKDDNVDGSKMFAFSGEEDDFDEEQEDAIGDIRNFSNEETRSRFTSYSMSSSVMSRTGGLQILDDQFEKMFESEYDDKDVGALDSEDIEGSVPIQSEIVNKLSQQYDQAVRLTSGGIETAIGEPNNEVKTRVMKSIQRNEEVEEVDLIDNETAPGDQKWDCESILSTFSNTYNRPKVIDITDSKNTKIRLNGEGIPFREEEGLTKRALKQLDGDFVKADDYAKSVCSRATAVSVSRVRGETTEERKSRKQQVKEFRRERRIEKKANSLAFKVEEYRQKQQGINVSSNLQGIKLL